MSERADGWVEVARFDDPMRADMTRDFLRDHDIPVRMRGNAGSTAVFNRFNTIVDIRLDVHERDLESAREALRALEIGPASEQPFRGQHPAASGDGAEAYIPPRKTMTALMLGVLMPIGAAHFYARHGAGGTILFAGVIGAVLGIFF